MYKKNCEGCGEEFSTENFRKKKCKPGCGRTDTNKTRNERTAITKAIRSKYFKCGLLRETYANSSGHCKHCRAIPRVEKIIANWERAVSENPDFDFSMQFWRDMKEQKEKLRQLKALTK